MDVPSLSIFRIQLKLKIKTNQPNHPSLLEFVYFSESVVTRGLGRRVNILGGTCY